MSFSRCHFELIGKIGVGKSTLLQNLQNRFSEERKETCFLLNEESFLNNSITPLLEKIYEKGKNPEIVHITELQLEKLFIIFRLPSLHLLPLLESKPICNYFQLRVLDKIARQTQREKMLSSFRDRPTEPLFWLMLYRIFVIYELRDFLTMSDILKIILYFRNLIIDMTGPSLLKDSGSTLTYITDRSAVDILVFLLEKIQSSSSELFRKDFLVLFCKAYLHTLLSIFSTDNVEDKFSSLLQKTIFLKEETCESTTIACDKLDYRLVWVDLPEWICNRHIAKRNRDAEIEHKTGEVKQTVISLNQNISKIYASLKCQPFSPSEVLESLDNSQNSVFEINVRPALKSLLLLTAKEFTHSFASTDESIDTVVNLSQIDSHIADFKSLAKIERPNEELQYICQLSLLLQGIDSNNQDAFTRLFFDSIVYFYGCETINPMVDRILAGDIFIPHSVQTKLRKAVADKKIKTKSPGSVDYTSPSVIQRFIFCSNINIE